MAPTIPDDLIELSHRNLDFEIANIDGRRRP